VSDIAWSGLAATVRGARGGFSLDIDVAVSAGTVLAVVGPNASGKSSLLLALAGFLELEDARVELNGRRVDELPPERRGIGMVFQDPLLFPHLTVLENVAFGPREHGASRRLARSIAGDWLDRLEIGMLADRRPAELSGGEAQRVALARALAVTPDLLLLDEPFAALDVDGHAALRADLVAHLAELAIPVVLVAHALADVATLADDVLAIEEGRVVQRGTLDHLTAAPATDFVRRFTAG
jgi:molybdate transport system ATP-binding protein